MKTKIFSVIMAVMLAAAMTACGDDVKTNSEAESETTSTAQTAAASQEESAVEEVSSLPDEVTFDPNEEDGQSPVMNLVGTYVTEKATMNVQSNDKGEADITIEWPESVTSYTTWTMTGTLNSENMTVEYSNCVKTIFKLNDTGEVANKDIKYKNGKGKIVFNMNNATASWDDSQEHIGDDMLFGFSYPSAQ